MNRWLVLPLLTLLTACVSYYQPEAALEDGVYYPEDDPAYRYNTEDFYYTRVAVYPWASLDGFYFGYWPYSTYGFGYRPYSGFRLSFVYPDEPGFAAGYYAFYSPWYSRAYATYYAPPVWWPYRDNCHHHGRCREHGEDRGDTRDGRYVADGGHVYGYPGGGGEENALYSNNVRNKMGNAGHPPAKRYVSKTTTGRAGYQDRTVKSKGFANSGRSRSKPAYTHSRGSVHDTQSAPPASTFSGNTGRSPSFASPSHSRSSGNGSARQKDRD